MLYECEVAVGFMHGQWVQEEVTVDVPNEGDGDLEGAIREAAENAAHNWADSGVSFVHMLYWTPAGDDEGGAQ